MCQHHLLHANGLRLPCRTRQKIKLCCARTFALATVPATRGFYLAHTPSLVHFKHLVNGTRHRRTTGGRTRPSCISRNEMIVWVTWLAGLNPQITSLYVRTPVRHSFQLIT